MLVANMLVFLRFLEVLDGLERSGRPVGAISSYFRQHPTSWCRAMTERQKLTINEATTMSTRAYMFRMPEHLGLCLSDPREFNTPEDVFKALPN